MRRSNIMRIKCLFWNINNQKSPFEKIIADITKEIDVLILAEASNISDPQLISLTGFKSINSPNPNDIVQYTPKFFSRESGFTLQHYHTVPSKRLVVNKLNVIDKQEVLLCGLHFPSKLSNNGLSQYAEAANYSTWISEAERIAKNKRTILVGDFNMNPFESGMISPIAFNATLSKTIALKDRKRTFHFQSYDYFYNPMWNFLGDISHNTGKDKLPGSYFYKNTSDSESIYWNVFDKVIMRPDAIANVELSTITYIETKSGHQLCNSNFEINKTNYADHLPLQFEIKM